MGAKLLFDKILVFCSSLVVLVCLVSLTLCEEVYYPEVAIYMLSCAEEPLSLKWARRQNHDTPSTYSTPLHRYSTPIPYYSTPDTIVQHTTVSLYCTSVSLYCTTASLYCTNVSMYCITVLYQCITALYKSITSLYQYIILL